MPSPRFGCKTKRIGYSYAHPCFSQSLGCGLETHQMMEQLTQSNPCPRVTCTWQRAVAAILEVLLKCISGHKKQSPNLKRQRSYNKLFSFHKFNLGSVHSPYLSTSILPCTYRHIFTSLWFPPLLLSFVSGKSSCTYSMHLTDIYLLDQPKCHDVTSSPAGPC